MREAGRLKRRRPGSRGRRPSAWRCGG